MGTVDKQYLKHIRSLPCLVCKKPGSEAHHLMIMGERGWGMRAGDDKAVPLCSHHHMRLHRLGNEYRFWDQHCVDPVEWSEEEWTKWCESQSKKST